MARSHPMRNIWSVVVTEHDPARMATESTSWRVDLRAAGQLAPLLRRTLMLAIGILAQTCQDLPDIERKVLSSLDDDVDGYPSGASHLGRSSGESDSTSDDSLIPQLTQAALQARTGLQLGLHLPGPAGLG